MESKKIVLATDVLIAFVDRSHPKHLHATAFFRYFAQEKYFLYTTPLVIADCYTLLHQRISPILAKDFIKAISLSSIIVMHPEDSDMKLAYKTILASSNPEITFEETLLATMSSRRNISYVCTFSYLHPLFRLQTFYLPI